MNINNTVKLGLLVLICIATAIVLPNWWQRYSGRNAETKPQEAISADMQAKVSTPEPSRLASRVENLPFKTDDIKAAAMVQGLSNSAVALVGIKTLEGQEEVNDLFQESFAMLIDSIARYGKTTVEGNRYKLVAQIPLEAQKAIRSHLYGGLERLIGNQGIDALVSQDIAENIDLQLFGFGERPITIIVEPGASARDAVRMTITGTYRFGTDINSHFTTKEMPKSALQNIYTSLASALNFKPNS